VFPTGASVSLGVQATKAWATPPVGSGKAARLLTPTASAPKLLTPPEDTRSAFVVKQVGEIRVRRLQEGEQLLIEPERHRPSAGPRKVV
jgi:hypothetical protein